MTLPQAIEVRSIDLSDEEVRSLLANLDDVGGDQTPTTDQRRDERCACRSYAILAAIHGQDEEQSVMIPLRNLSQNGLAFLHDKRIEEGARCSVRIMLADGATLDLQGKVVRCREAGKGAFEVGLKLDQKIHVYIGKKLVWDRDRCRIE